MKVLIAAYNDEGTIKATLDSVSDFDVHVFDGRFKDFPGKGWYSTDKTLEIARSYQNVTIHEAIPNETQCEKRTRMFSILEEGEYGLKLDADEVLLNHIEGVKDKDVYWAWTISPLYDYPYVTARIFKKHTGMHYAGKHHFLYDAQQKLIASDQNMGQAYTHETLKFRVFNARNHRGKNRDVQKRLFLSTRKERAIKSETEVYGPQQMKRHPDRAQQTRKPVDVLLESDNPKYTYSIIFSRPWAVAKYFRKLDNLQLPLCEVICVVDTDNPSFYKKVQQELLKRKWSGVKTYMTGNPAPHEKRLVNERRLRIAKNLHVILTEAKGDILLGSEDDSLPQPDAYPRLIEHLKHADFAQATIVGRWQPTIPAWHVEERDGKPYKIWTGEKKTGIEEVQGMGWYCFAVKTDAMRSIRMHWDYCHHIGPDWHMGYDMWKRGYRLLHDHDIHVTHFGEDFELTLDANTVKKTWVKQGDTWQSLTS